jgi:hypothetical protein
VNFGDALLARSTDFTDRTDQQAFVARDGHIPPPGTGLILRIRRLPKAESH